MVQVIFLGAPGSGKGTQTSRLSKHLGISNISTGDLIRAEIMLGSTLGKKVGPFIENGQLVPDSIMIDLFQRQLHLPAFRKGFISDGFPRTLSQAKAFDEILQAFDGSKCFIFYLNVGREIIQKRVMGRRSCPECGTVFHVINSPSRQENICDECGGNLVIRTDDSETLILKRYEVYTSMIDPVLRYYGGRLFEIDGAQDANIVTNQIKTQIGDVR